MNHKNFHFTESPDKTNDVIFLESPKTMFFGHYWSFLPNGDFFQKIRLSHTTINRPPAPCQVLEKAIEPIPRKLTDRRKDRQTLFYDPSG